MPKKKKKSSSTFSKARLTRGSTAFFTRCGPGTSQRFPAGTGICHCFINNSKQDALLLGGGEASRSDNRIYYPLNPNAAMICRGANGGRMFRSAAWDRMTGCPTRFEDGLSIGFPAYVRNLGDLTPNPFPWWEGEPEWLEYLFPRGKGNQKLGRLNPEGGVHIISRSSSDRTIVERNYGTQKSNFFR